MKILYLLLIFTGITAAAAAQPPGNRLLLYSAALKLDVSPQEQLIVTSKGGEIAMGAFDINGVRGMSNDIGIPRFIREVFPSFLEDPDKIAALRTLVKKRYMSPK